MSPRADDIARMNRTGSSIVAPARAGMRLDTYLAKTFRYRSRTRWAALIREGRILLNGAPARAGQVLREGDRIEYQRQERPEPGVSRAWRVIHEDDSILAISKPANLPVHPSGRYFHNTLLTLLLAERGESLDAATLRVVHRLDRETSGLILFGKGREAAAALATQFESRQVRKEYLALVHGVPTEDRFSVDAPIGPDLESPVRKAMTVTAAGKPSRTLFRVIRRGNESALLRARPLTGRLHQIRVHLRASGHPIIGDKVYGLDPHLFIRFAAGNLSAEDRQRLVWRRQALHAARLRFRHPADGRILDLRSPVGRKWIRCMRRLGMVVP